MTDQWIAGTHEHPDMEVLSESALAMAQATIQNAMDQANLNRAALARKMDSPRSFVSRMLSGSHNLTIKTMARALGACGYEIEFGLTPVKWYWASNEPEPIKCNTVPALEGTLLPTSFDSLAEGCPSWHASGLFN